MKVVVVVELETVVELEVELETVVELEVELETVVKNTERENLIHYNC
jgi:hypothetical protein